MAPDFTGTLSVPIPPPGADPAGGDPEFANGITCTDTPELLHVYGWTPATAQEWAAIVANLTGPDSAWFTEAGPRGIYLTYKTAPAFADENGYDQTYLFTGDAIMIAPTKADTDFITGPPAK